MVFGRRRQKSVFGQMKASEFCKYFRRILIASYLFLLFPILHKFFGGKCIVPRLSDEVTFISIKPHKSIKPKGLLQFATTAELECWTSFLIVILFFPVLSLYPYFIIIFLFSYVNAHCLFIRHFWIQEEECFLSKHNKTKQVSIHIHQKHCDCFLNMNLSPTSTFPSFPNNCNCVLWEK